MTRNLRELISTMRQVIKRCIRHAMRSLVYLYTMPLRMNERLAYFVRGSCLSLGNEHLYRAVLYIQSNVAIDGKSLIVDIGAAGGGTAAYLRRAFPENPIIAFEPNPRVAMELASRVLRIGNMVVSPKALGAIIRQEILHVTANNVSSSLRPIDEKEIKRLPTSAQRNLRCESTVPVHVSTLDEELRHAGHVLLIKIDTQGTELEILQGACNTLRQTAFVLTEMDNHNLYNNTCQYYDIDAFLRSNGFRLIDIIVSYYPSSGMTEFDALYQNLASHGAMGSTPRAESI